MQALPVVARSIYLCGKQSKGIRKTIFGQMNLPWFLAELTIID